MATTAALLAAAFAIGAGVLITRDRKNAGAKKVVLVISASDTHGGYGDSSGNLQRYDPTPVELLQAGGKLDYIDKTVNGMQLAEVLAGGNVASAVPGTGEPTTTESLTELIRNNPAASIVFIGTWMADRLFYGKSDAQIIEMLDEACKTVLMSGKTPVVRGANNFVINSVMTTELYANLVNCNSAIQAWCAAQGIPFIDVLSVPFYGSADLAPDNFHPTFEYHERICAFEADRLIEISQA